MAWVGRRRWHTLQTFALQSARCAYGPHLWGAAVVGEGELSYSWQMQHYWELSRVIGKERNERHVRKAGGEVDMACAVSTDSCSCKGTCDARKTRNLSCQEQSSRS